jgi:hypothetical protein
LHLASGECTSLRSAATLVGISHQALSAALRKPSVSAFLEAQMRAQRVFDRLQARVVLRKLADSAKSSFVRLEAAKHMDRDEPSGFGGAAGVTIRIDLG